MELVEEFVSRRDTLHLIIELLEPLDRAGDGWLLIHSMFMLGIIGSRDSFEALRELVKRVIIILFQLPAVYAPYLKPFKHVCY